MFTFLNLQALKRAGQKKIQHCNFNPKRIKKTLQAINDAITAAAEEGKTSKFGGKIPTNKKSRLETATRKKARRRQLRGHDVLKRVKR
jgi:hypothetical protein